MGERSRFAGGDQEYLRDVQYRDATKLSARANLHLRYGVAATRWFPWLVAQVPWSEGDEVLEVGCGPGWLWVEAAEHLPPGLQLTLTDLSPGMVDTAMTQVAAIAHYAAVEGGPADAQDLAFDDRSFDVVVANHMLYHVPDPALAVAELARVVRPDGVVVAATNGPGHLAELMEIRSSVFGTPVHHGTIDVFGAESGRPILEAAFGSVDWRGHPAGLRCTDPADVVAYLTSFPPGEDATRAELDQLVDAVEQRFRAGGGVLAVTKVAGLFLCRP